MPRVAAAVGFHRRHGTTTLVASLVSLGPVELALRVKMLSALVRRDSSPEFTSRARGCRFSVAVRTIPRCFAILTLANSICFFFARR